MIKIVKQIKKNPQGIDVGKWGRDHDWNSAVILTTVERIQNKLKVDLWTADKLGLAAYILTIRCQDAWEAAVDFKVSKEELDAPTTKDDIDMGPDTLCLEIFKEWFSQDANKITENTNPIGSMKRLVAIYCEKLCEGLYPEDKVAKLLHL